MQPGPQLARLSGWPDRADGGCRSAALPQLRVAAQQSEAEPGAQHRARSAQQLYATRLPGSYARPEASQSGVSTPRGGGRPQSGFAEVYPRQAAASRQQSGFSEAHSELPPGFGEPVPLAGTPRVAQPVSWQPAAEADPPAGTPRGRRQQASVTGQQPSAEPDLGRASVGSHRSQHAQAPAFRQPQPDLARASAGSQRHAQPGAYRQPEPDLERPSGTPRAGARAQPRWEEQPAVPHSAFLQDAEIDSLAHEDPRAGYGQQQQPQQPPQPALAQLRTGSQRSLLPRVSEANSQEMAAASTPRAAQVQGPAASPHTQRQLPSPPGSPAHSFRQELQPASSAVSTPRQLPAGDHILRSFKELEELANR